MICRLLFGILSLCIRNQQLIRVFLLWALTPITHLGDNFFYCLSTPIDLKFCEGRIPGCLIYKYIPVLVQWLTHGKYSLNMPKTLKWWLTWLVIASRVKRRGRNGQSNWKREVFACCDSRGRKELDTTEWVNWPELNRAWTIACKFPFSQRSGKHATSTALRTRVAVIYLFILSFWCFFFLPIKCAFGPFGPQCEGLEFLSDLFPKVH